MCFLGGRWASAAVSVFARGRLGVVLLGPGTWVAGVASVLVCLGWGVPSGCIVRDVLVGSMRVACAVFACVTLVGELCECGRSACCACLVSCDAGVVCMLVVVGVGGAS